MRKRNHAVTFRLSEDEYSVLTEQIEKVELTEQSFIINAIKEATILPPAPLQELNHQLADLSSQVRGMATNVNQLAKKANANMAFPLQAELCTLSEQLAELRRECNEIWQLTRRLISEQKPMLH